MSTNALGLSKREILRRSADFDEVFSKGIRLRGRCVDLIFVPSAERKVGFAVSRKIRKAVIRNRFKRILRELYRHNKEPFEGKKAVILGKTLTEPLSLRQLKPDFEYLLVRLKHYDDGDPVQRNRGTY